MLNIQSWLGNGKMIGFIVLSITSIILFIISKILMGKLDEAAGHIYWGHGMMSKFNNPLIRFFQESNLMRGLQILQMGEQMHSTGKIFYTITVILSILSFLGALVCLGLFFYA